MLRFEFENQATLNKLVYLQKCIYNQLPPTSQERSLSSPLRSIHSLTTPAVNSIQTTTHSTATPKNALPILDHSIALAASITATPTPQRNPAIPPGTPIDPGVRIPMGTFCTTTSTQGVLGCNTGNGGTFNIVDGKISGCTGCTKENGFGR
jgi:hypothetical protein